MATGTSRDTDGEATALVRMTLASIRDLTEVLTEETETVRRQDAAELAALQPRKARLILAYRAHLKTIATQHEAAKGALAAMRRDLEIDGQKLAEATHKNVSALMAARTATQGLLETFFQMVREEKRATHCYADPRVGALPPDSIGPVAFNRTI